MSKCTKPNGHKTCIRTGYSESEFYACPLINSCPKLIKAKWDNYRRELRLHGPEIVQPFYHHIDVEPERAAQTVLLK